MKPPIPQQRSDQSTVQNIQYARLSKVSRVQLFKALLTWWISYHFTTLWANSTEDKLSRQFALNVKSCFLKNKNISKCHLLRFFLSRVLRVYLYHSLGKISQQQAYIWAGHSISYNIACVLKRKIRWACASMQADHSLHCPRKCFGSLPTHRMPCKDWSGPKVIKLFSCLTPMSMKFFMLIDLKILKIENSFLLNTAEHEIFSANKYENANYCWHFHIY